MNIRKLNWSFLTIGKTAESTEGSGFKRYIGVAGSYVLDVNPDKKKLDELLGYESQNEPEYTGSNDNGNFARITFIVRTDPKTNNDIEITNRLTFTLYNTPAYNRDNTKVQVIDTYGNSTWTNIEDAKAGKKILNADGSSKKFGDTYHIAYRGEADLVTFLKTYLGVQDAFNYNHGMWSLKSNASDCIFGLEHIKDYFTGNVSELREALKLQPNNKVKLLYGVRTADDGRQFQTIAARGELILRNNANSSAYAKLEKDLFNALQAGSYAGTEFKVQDLAEYTVQPSNLNKESSSDDPFASSDSDLPWNA